MSRLLASWWGSGLLLHRLRGSHGGSGSVATVCTLPLAWLLSPWWPAGLAAGAVVAVGGLFAVHAYLRSHPEEGDDPAWVVVDEAAGALLACAGQPGWWLLAAAGLFRLFDIWKEPVLVRRSQWLPGGLGVVADDVVAGLYALALVTLARVAVS